VFGTFLTRSGILSSIHTFTEGPIGKWFLPFLAVMLLGGIGIVLARLDELRSESRFDSVLSRESAFLANNVLFVAAAFTVLWGTIYPIIAEVFSGVRLSVGPPFFNSVFVPLGLAIIALAGIGPLISWRRMSKGAFARVVKIPLGAGAMVIAAGAVTGLRSPGVLLAFGLCAFTTAAIVGEFVRGSRVHRARDALGWVPALGATVSRNRRRYGGYVVHLGVILIVLGLAGSAFRTERHALIDVGESMTVGSYTLTYADRQEYATEEKRVNTVVLDVSNDGRPIGTLAPQRNFHIAQGQPQSEVAIRTGPVEDLYVVITSIDGDGAAAIRAFVNPLTWWIWAGAAVMLAGMTILLSQPSPVRVTAGARSEVREPAVATR
jgi:cytochrome c-type biogenesis protein CcmF